jgi:hypothetical protein
VTVANVDTEFFRAVYAWGMATIRVLVAKSDLDLGDQSFEVKETELRHSVEAVSSVLLKALRAWNAPQAAIGFHVLAGVLGVLAEELDPDGPTPDDPFDEDEEG